MTIWVLYNWRNHGEYQAAGYGERFNRVIARPSFASGPPEDYRQMSGDLDDEISMVLRPVSLRHVATQVANGMIEHKQYHESHRQEFIELAIPRIESAYRAAVYELGIDAAPFEEDA